MSDRSNTLPHRDPEHGPVLAQMLAALGRRLPRHTVRQSDDPAVALLDAWAVVCELIRFYNGRILDEGYLATAVERRSVLELARQIGYELHPGVAAGTWLAFVVEDAAGGPESVVVPAGTAVRSVPGQGERPQTFETERELVARSDRSLVRLRRRHHPELVLGDTHALLAGVGTGLRVGDAILVVGDHRKQHGFSEKWDFRILTVVEPVTPDGPDDPPVTRVEWEMGLGMDRQWGAEPVPAQPAETNVEVYAFRRRANLFGHNAPPWRSMPEEIRRRYAGEEHERRRQWPGFQLPQPGEEPVIDLDAQYPVVPGSWIVLRRPAYKELYRLTRVDDSAREDFGLSAKTSRLYLDTGEHLSWFGIRQTTVYCQSERLDLVGAPVTEPVTGAVLELQHPVDFEPRTPLVVADAHRAEVVRVAVVSGATVQLQDPLADAIDPQTARVYGNVVRASHGETREEALGSGDGSRSGQRFTLAAPDLTYVAAPTPSGVRATLELRVDGLAWQERRSLFGLRPDEFGYTVRVDDDGRAHVVLGDGVSGARLPTGLENIRARYRTGLGPGGNVAAGAVSLPAQRPLGIREVTNPLPAAGGAAAESLADARMNAPLTVRTLDRVVSLRDHEDFVRAFGGIGKARAVVRWGGAAPYVHVVVAAPDNARVDDDTLAVLRAALDAVRDPSHSVRIERHRPESFGVSLDVLVDAAHQADEVLAAVVAAIEAEYSFPRREFGQPVTESELVRLVQQVPGVVACRLPRARVSQPFRQPPTRPEAPVLPVPPAAPVLPVAPWFPDFDQLLLADPKRIVVRELHHD